MTAPLASRRSFITGLVSLVAAPAIVRAGSLMPVRVMVEPARKWVQIGSTGTVFLKVDHSVSDAPVLIGDDFLVNLFGILNRHPRASTAQIIEMVRTRSGNS
jgi:hypothetical protein